MGGGEGMAETRGVVRISNSSRPGRKGGKCGKGLRLRDCDAAPVVAMAEGKGPRTRRSAVVAMAHQLEGDACLLYPFFFFSSFLMQ